MPHCQVTYDCLVKRFAYILYPSSMLYILSEQGEHYPVASFAGDRVLPGGKYGCVHCTFYWDVYLQYHPSSKLHSRVSKQLLVLE